MSKSPVSLKDNTDPLYAVVEQKIREKIRSNEYAPGSRLPSQQVLSRIFDVSMITVRRAVRDLVNAGLLESRSGSGTYVRKLRSGAGQGNTAGTVAVIFRNISGGYPLFKAVVARLRRLCSERGLGIQALELPHGASGLDDEYAPVLAGLAGAILTSPVDLHTVCALQDNAIPYVLLHNDVVDGRSVSVSSNYASGTVQAVNWLRKRKCRSLALITAESTRFSAGQMALGFDLALQGQGRGTQRHSLHQIGYRPRDTFKLVREWIRKKQIPDGIILADVSMGQAAVDALEPSGMQVPRDVKVVAWGQADEPDAGDGKVVVIDARYEQVALTAMQVLERMMRGGEPEARRFVIEPELVVEA